MDTALGMGLSVLVWTLNCCVVFGHSLARSGPPLPEAERNLGIRACPFCSETLGLGDMGIVRLGAAWSRNSWEGVAEN